MIFHTQTDSQTGWPDTVLILDPREPFIQPFGFTDWNEIVLSFRLSATTLLENNAHVTNDEDVSYSNSRDGIFMGLKSANSVFPLEGNTNFVGVGGINENAHLDRIYSGHRYEHYLKVRAAPTDWSGAALLLESFCALSNNLTDKKGSSPLGHFYLHYQKAWRNNYNKCNFVQIRFKVYNKGSSNQSIGVRWFFNSLDDWRHNNDLFDKVNKEYLQKIETSTQSELTDENIFNWNISSLPLDLPNAFFVYFPFSICRIKIHQWSVKRLS